MESTQEHRRKYTRHKAPKDLFVAWKAAGQRTVSRAEAVGLGGLYLYTQNPPSVGSIIELLFDLKAGEVRARAVVRHRSTGKGMGVQFMQMQAADRARLNQFLSQCPARHIPDDSGGSRSASPSSRQNELSSDKTEEAVQFEGELDKALGLARNGTYYQLLGVAADSSAKEIRQSFYGLARKFHPDYHMGNAEWMGALKEIVGTATSAYKTLIDEEKRAEYDSLLMASGAHHLRRIKTAGQEKVEQFFSHANECLRAGNYVGSIVWLRKCVHTVPEEPRYHALLARSLSTVGQYQKEAIQEFQRAIELGPWDTVPYIQLAELYESMQLPSQARPLYSKVLEIDPFHAKARERLSSMSIRA